MNRSAWLLMIALGSLPVLAQARGHVSVGVGIGVGPGYYGSGYYGSPYYYPYAPSYYYGPGYYEPPRYYQAPVYQQAPEPVGEAPDSNWYYCPDSRNYYPYVKQCPAGWQTVPAQPGSVAPPPRDRAAGHAPASKVVYRFGDLLFAEGRSELKPNAETSLRALLASINHEKSYRHVTIEGHTDSSGSGAANRELSQRRAESVRQYLIAHGVPADRITALGKGEADPIADNDTADGRQLNRRVDVIVS